MPARIVSAIRSVAAAVSLLAFLVAFVFGRAGGPSLPIVLAASVVSVIALAIAAGPGAILSLVGRPVGRADGDAEGRDGASDWWLARFEPAVDEVWDRQADYALAGGLAVVGVIALAMLVTRSGDDPPLELLVLGLLCLNGALIMLAGASISE